MWHLYWLPWWGSCVARVLPWVCLPPSRSEQLIRQYRRDEPWLQVDMRHLSTYSKQLHDLIRDSPNDYIPVVSRCSPGLPSATEPWHSALVGRPPAIPAPPPRR